MTTVFNISYSQGGRRFGRMSRTPGWVARAALTVAGLVLLLPIALLIIAALLAGMLVFMGLSLVLWLVMVMRSLVTRVRGGKSMGHTANPLANWDVEGRRNVRVRRG